MWNIIVDYFIDNTITIRDDDNTKNTIKKFLLKYRRIIGIILLIILLIIGYYCNPYDYNYDKQNLKQNLKQNQKGGAGAIASIASKANAVSDTVSNAAGKAEGAVGNITNAAGNVPGVPGANNAAGNEAGNNEGNNKGKKGIGGHIYGAGAAVGRQAKEWAPWFYGVIYAVAISLVVCIVVVPSVAFFVVGIICYILLKDKIKYMKAL